MRDDHGHFGRYKQSLYYARLLIEQLEGQEQGGSESSRPFARQQLQCFFESAVIQLMRSFCSLACVALPAEKTSSLLNAPGSAERVLREAADELPTASLKTLCQALNTAGSGVSTTASAANAEDEPLGQLLLVYGALWAGESSVVSADPSLIQSSSRQRGSTECRGWYRQLQQLGDDIVNLQTES